MSAHRCGRWLAVAAAAAMAVIASRPDPAEASLPIPFAFVGCVTNGRFEVGAQLTPMLVHPALLALEGKTIRVEGSLSLLDFYADAVFVVDEQCRETLHRSYPLCN